MKNLFLEAYDNYMNEASNASVKNTLGQVVTELFPCLYFYANRSIDPEAEEFPKDIWKILVKRGIKHYENDENNPFYLMGSSNAKTKKYTTYDGLNSIWKIYNDAGGDSISNKLQQAKLIYEKILKDFPDAEAVVWGDQCQPQGLQSSEADIYVKENGIYTGISLKATKSNKGGFSLKNRTTLTWFTSILGKDDGVEKVMEIQNAVNKTYPDNIGSIDNEKERRVALEEWMTEDDRTADEMQQLYLDVKNAYYQTFAECMNSISPKILPTGLLKAMFDDISETPDFDLRVWKATNSQVSELSGSDSPLDNLVQNIKASRKFKFYQDGQSGIIMEYTYLKNGKPITDRLRIESRQSHSLHGYEHISARFGIKKDTYFSTVMKSVIGWQIMPKPKF